MAREMEKAKEVREKARRWKLGGGNSKDAGRDKKQVTKKRKSVTTPTVITAESKDNDMHTRVR